MSDIVSEFRILVVAQQKTGFTTVVRGIIVPFIDLGKFNPPAAAHCTGIPNFVDGIIRNLIIISDVFTEYTITVCALALSDIINDVVSDYISVRTNIHADAT
jgi:hypothetical protein